MFMVTSVVFGLVAYLLGVVFTVSSARCKGGNVATLGKDRTYVKWSFARREDRTTEHKKRRREFVFRETNCKPKAFGHALAYVLSGTESTHTRECECDPE